MDFVLQRGDRIVAIEVKTGLHRGALLGMDEFKKRFRLCEPLLVGEGGIPLNEFLTAPVGHWFEGASP